MKIVIIIDDAVIFSKFHFTSEKLFPGENLAKVCIFSSVYVFHCHIFLMHYIRK